MSWSPKCAFLSVQPPKSVISYITATLPAARHTVTYYHRRCAAQSISCSPTPRRAEDHSGWARGVRRFSSAPGAAHLELLTSSWVLFLKQNNRLHQEEESIFIKIKLQVLIFSLLVRKPQGLWQGKRWRGTCPAGPRKVSRLSSRNAICTKWREAYSHCKGLCVSFYTQDCITQFYPQHH